MTMTEHNVIETLSDCLLYFWRHKCEPSHVCMYIYDLAWQQPYGTKTGTSSILFSHVAIVYNHWSDTREFITRTVELWNRWISQSCYYNI